MAVISNTVWTRLRSMTLALTLVALLLPTVLTAPVSADRVEETDHAISAAFDLLRTAIERTDGLSPQHQSAFLAKADAAERALLLPAVQAAREARNERAAVHILEALQRQNQALSDNLGYDGDAIDSQATAIRGYILTDAWPKKFN